MCRCVHVCVCRYVLGLGLVQGREPTARERWRWGICGSISCSDGELQVIYVDIT